MIINKFGGEIMDSPELVALAAAELTKQQARGEQPVVVVSALKGVTDELVLVLRRLHEKRQANGIVRLFIADITEKYERWIGNLESGIRNQESGIKEKAQKQISAGIQELEQDLKVVARFGEIAEVSDRVLSWGEKLSSYLFTARLESAGLRAVRYTGEELGIVTDNNFGDANVDLVVSAKNIRAKIKKGQKTIPVVTGFIGRTINNQTTTLGRGGSDTTACLLGAALKASKVILWKNVAGVLTADPKIVPEAKTVKSLDYDQAEESGKVIHDKSMSFIRAAGTTVEVAYMQDPRYKTVINASGGQGQGVKIISVKDNLRLLVVVGDKIKRYGALAEISKIITQHQINMALIRNTRDSLYIALERNGYDTSGCEAQITSLGYQLKTQNVSMVTVIGRIQWHLVEQFNHILHTAYPTALLGAFPYHDCVRLEAAVEPEQAENLVRKFHEKFIK